MREPVPEAEMDNVKHNSIYQVLRDIYHLSVDEEVRVRCRIATAMAKAMHKKLVEYQANPLFAYPEIATGDNTIVVKPYLRRNMVRTNLHGRGERICHTVQEIFLMSTDPEILFKCCVGMRMTKLIYAQLVQYAIANKKVV